MGPRTADVSPARIGAGLALATHWTRDRDLPANDGDRGALLNRSDGRWLLDMPDAGLRLSRASGQLRPVAYLPLLRARF